jgi:large subunit ribosomal protein L22
MRGPKLNEGATIATYRAYERHGTKATARHIRASASKARIVLDLIRGLDVKRADEVLQVTDRGIATDIRKVLASAVANASNPGNTGSYIADADELFVLACFADEGPTLKRFAARARGRGTRIRKRTCHITVVVARMSDQRLSVVQARAEGAGASAAASRRARVERSRTRAQAAKAAQSGAAEGVADDVVDDSDGVEIDDVQALAGVHAQDAAEGEPISDDDVETAEPTTSDEGADQAATTALAAGEWAGSVVADDEGNGPETHPIKGNADSMLYHTPDSRYYAITKAEVWFDTEEHAEAAGFSKPAAQSAADENDGDDNDGAEGDK